MFSSSFCNSSFSYLNLSKIQMEVDNGYHRELIHKEIVHFLTPIKIECRLFFNVGTVLSSFSIHSSFTVLILSD